MQARAEGGPRHLMSRKNESVAWRAFVKLGGNKVVCRICGKQMNYQSGSSTSNMVKHLQAVHTHILADAPNSQRYPKHNTATVEVDDLTTGSNTDPWFVLQQAPANLRQRWKDLKQNLHKEMQQHQQAVAWSAIGAPCLGAPAGADLLTDSQPSTPCWGNSTPSNGITTTTTAIANNSSSNNNSNEANTGVDWRNEECEESCDMTSLYQFRVKAEPIETDDVVEQIDERPRSNSPPPQPLSPSPPPPPHHCSSPTVAPPSAPGGGGAPPPPQSHDGPPPSKNKKHTATQTSLTPQPLSQKCTASAELELRLIGLRRAQQRAEELHHEHLRESRARAEAAQAERDHRLQLIRHAEELHHQAMEAQRQALEHSRQLHEMTLRQGQKPSD